MFGVPTAVPVAPEGVPGNPMDDSGFEEPPEPPETPEATTKATKADDAGVAVENWDAKLVEGLGLVLHERTARAAKVLRGWRLKCWKRLQAPGFFPWLHQRPADYQGVGLDSMEHGVCHRSGGNGKSSGWQTGGSSFRAPVGHAWTSSVLWLVGGRQCETLQGFGTGSRRHC